MLAFKLNSPGQFQKPVKSEIRHTTQKWVIERMPIYRRFNLILLVVLLKLNEVILAFYNNNTQEAKIVKTQSAYKH